jgi:hypothetical protein
MHEFDKLGSINDFAESYRLDPRSQEALKRYTQILADRREVVTSRQAAETPAVESAPEPHIYPEGMRYILP